MDPQTLMMMQALSGGSGARMNPVAMENQLQMMRRLGSPLYANSPYRSGNSPIVPGANPYNQIRQPPQLQRRCSLRRGQCRWTDMPGTRPPGPSNVNGLDGRRKRTADAVPQTLQTLAARQSI